MLILKGKQGKSRVIDNLRHSLRHSTASICFEYVERRPVMYDSVYVLREEYTLMEFAEGIHDCVKNNYDYTYIFIYTNKTEEELLDVIQWLDKQPYNHKIILTCQ